MVGLICRAARSRARSRLRRPTPTPRRPTPTPPTFPLFFVVFVFKSNIDALFTKSAYGLLPPPPGFPAAHAVALFFHAFSFSPMSPIARPRLCFLCLRLVPVGHVLPCSRKPPVELVGIALPSAAAGGHVDGVLQGADTRGQSARLQADVRKGATAVSPLSCRNLARFSLCVCATPPLSSNSSSGLVFSFRSPFSCSVSSQVFAAVLMLPRPLRFSSDSPRPLALYFSSFLSFARIPGLSLPSHGGFVVVVVVRSSCHLHGSSFFGFIFCCVCPSGLLIVVVALRLR